ncbi:hypothetical protein [Aeribacillus pallidus]|jgi:MFS family permease|uniref:hypothetical protein n=1 Tax=Aeribacillus pallidus TaxID=33936 RepID=UPI003D1CA091
MRTFLAVVAGLVAGGVAIFFLETISHIFYPPPADININDPDALREFIQQAPVGALVLVAVAWAVGSFVGGLVTQLIAKRHQRRLPLVTGGILMAMGLLNLILLPHPIWFWVVGLAVYLPMAYVGGKSALVFKRES